MSQGKFITIYGINNVGKTTQAKLIVQQMKKMGLKAEYVKYPVYKLKPTGTFLNKILRGGKKQQISEEELQMWFTLNRYQFEPTLQEKLAKGINIVAEDYIGTGIAWGAAKGADLKWLEELNRDLMKEDLAIFLTGKRQIEAKEKRHIHETNDKLVEKCDEVYKKLAKRYNWKIVEVIDGDIQGTTEEIWKTMGKF